MSTSGLPRGELAASLAARRELGPDYDAAFVEAVAERIEAAAATRRTAPAEWTERSEHAERSVAVTVVCVSLVVSIPVSAIAAVNAGLAGLAIVWLGIVAINVAFALRRPRR
jgi:hypothetical protein